MRGRRVHEIARLWVVALLMGVTILPVSRPTATEAFEAGLALDSFQTPAWTTLPVATDGETVVWLTPESDWTVNGARLADRQPFVVAAIGDDDELVTDYSGVKIDVGGNLVVWGPDGDGAIHGVNLETGDDLIVADRQAELIDLHVSGGWVVWQHQSEKTTWIKTRDVHAMGAITVLAEGALGDHLPVGNLRVDDGWIIWAEDYEVSETREGFRTLVALRAGELESIQRFDISDTTYPGQISLDNGRAVYPQPPLIDAPSRSIWANATMFQLAGGWGHGVGFSYEVTASDSPYPYVATEYLAYDGRYLIQPFVVDTPTGSTGNPSNVVAYDTRIGETFVIDRGNLRSLAAEGGAVAWAAADGCCAQTVYATRTADLSAFAPVPDSRPPSPDYTWFPETGHYLGYGFKDYWERTGGLPVFGYPISEEFQFERGGAPLTVQFFERAVFEWHSENHGTPYEVLLRHVAVDLLNLQGRSWYGFPRGDPAEPHYFPDTGHNIDTLFWDYWSIHGLEFGDPGVTFREALALFGYPLSQSFVETNGDGDTVLTQYFERAVFEYHPDNPDPWRVLLRRVGAELAAEQQP